MWKAGLLIVQLIAAAAPGDTAQGVGASGPASMSCTYQRCMAKCTKLSGPVCHSYCESKIEQRRIRGICRS